MSTPTPAAPAAAQGATPSVNRLQVVQILVGIFLSVVAGYSAWKINLADASLKEAEQGIKLREADRQNRESLERKQMLVYEAVVKSLESGETKRQAVSKALVTSMLEDPLRSELLAVLTTSASPEISREAQITLDQERRFKAEENVAAAGEPRTAAGWADWDFDIFWCERSGESAKSLAERIKRQLETEGAKGRLRVRMLPDSINARPGYQHSGYVIRYNTGEEAQAKKLKTLGDTVMGQASFIASLSQQSTPWYISAFACPAAR